MQTENSPKDNGWIKLHRSLLDNPIIEKPAYNHLWTILLLLASHNERGFIWGGEQIKLNPGQFVTGRKKLSKISGLHESSIQRILKYLEIEQQIEQQTFNKFRIITIKNWGKYQSTENSEHKGEHTGEQQANTFKKEKNDKNKNIYTDFSFVLGSGESWLLPKVKFDEYKKTYPDLDIESQFRKAAQWLTDNPTKRKTKNGMPRFLNGWLSRGKLPQSQEKGGNRNGRTEYSQTGRNFESQQSEYGKTI